MQKRNTTRYSHRKPIHAFSFLLSVGEADQLQIWADRVGVPIVRQQMGSDPASVAFDTVQSSVKQNADVVLIDTAGRLHHNKVDYLMNELIKVKRVMQKVLPHAPNEVMLVLDGSTGQNAFEQAKDFTAATDVSSIESEKVGEVVLYGSQLDSLTGYWKRQELAWKFMAEEHTSEDGLTSMRYHYRTGDRGILDPNGRSLRIFGRIGGEDGMVKVNGVRIELGEIEAAIVDNFFDSFIRHRMTICRNTEASTFRPGLGIGLARNKDNNIIIIIIVSFNYYCDKRVLCLSTVDIFVCVAASLVWNRRDYNTVLLPTTQHKRDTALVM